MLPIGRRQRCGGRRPLDQVRVKNPAAKLLEAGIRSDRKKPMAVGGGGGEKKKKGSDREARAPLKTGFRKSWSRGSEEATPGGEEVSVDRRAVLRVEHRLTGLQGRGTSVLSASPEH